MGTCSGAILRLELMAQTHSSVSSGAGGRTYVFRVVVEPDGDAWSAYCPALLRQGGATWGTSPEEALRHIEEVVKMVVESLIEHGDPVPQDTAGRTVVPSESQVVVTV